MRVIRDNNGVIAYMSDYDDNNDIDDDDDATAAAADAEHARMTAIVE